MSGTRTVTLIMKLMLWYTLVTSPSRIGAKAHNPRLIGVQSNRSLRVKFASDLSGWSVRCCGCACCPRWLQSARWGWHDASCCCCCPPCRVPCPTGCRLYAPPCWCHHSHSCSLTCCGPLRLGPADWNREQRPEGKNLNTHVLFATWFH